VTRVRRSLARDAVKLVGLVAALFLFLSPGLVAQAKVELDDKGRSAVAQALYQASVTTAVIEERANAQLTEQARVIAELKSQVRGASAEAGASQQKAQEARRALTAAQEAFVSQLARMDETYSRQVAAFRGAFEDIASTPEGVAELERFNAGQKAEAVRNLIRIRDANDHARKIKSAAEARTIALLAIDARQSGQLRIDEVVPLLETVTALDGLNDDWLRLAHLYIDAGRLTDAVRAAKQADRVAVDQIEHADALDGLGDAELAQNHPDEARAAWTRARQILLSEAITADPVAEGDQPRSTGPAFEARYGKVLMKLALLEQSQGHLKEALALLNEAVRTLRGFGDDTTVVKDGDKVVLDLTADLSDIFAQMDTNYGRNLGLALVKRADLQLLMGAPDQARANFAEALKLRKRLTDAMPISLLLSSEYAALQQQMARLGFLMAETPTRPGLRAEPCATAKDAMTADPNALSAQVGLIACLAELTSMRLGAGDLKAAHDSASQALSVGAASRLKSQQDVGLLSITAIAESLLGDVLVQEKDFQQARAHYLKSVQTFSDLVERHPQTIAHMRDASLTLNRLTRLEIAVGDDARALDHARESLALTRRVIALGSPSTGWLVDHVRALSDVRQLGGDVSASELLAAADAAEAAGQLGPLEQEVIDIARRVANPPIAKAK
jgi:tetratricopeptide (TPR) repeat protein